MCRRKCIIERSRKPSRKTTCIYTTGHHSLNPLWQPTKFSSFPSDLTRTIILWLSLAPSLSLFICIYIYIQYTLSCSSVFRTEPNGPRICCRLYSWTGGWLALFIPSKGRAVSRGSAPAVIQLPIPSRISFRNLIRPVMDRDEYISTR